MKEKRPFRVSRRNVWNMFSTFGPGRHREALVFLYFETGPVTTWTGLYSAPIVDIAKFTCLTVKEVLDAINTLSRWGLIVYDHDRQLVCVKGLLLRQARYRPNEDQVTGIVRHVEEMPEDSPAVIAFIKEHMETPELAEHFEGIYELDNPPDRCMDRGVEQGTEQGTGGEVRSKNLEVRTENEEGKSESGITRDDRVIPSCVQPFSLTPESTSKSDGDPQVKISPNGSSPSSTPRAGKSKPTAKASGKGKPGNGHGLSDAGLKKKGLAIAQKKLASGEWDLSRVSEVLRDEYGYTSADINSKALLDALGLFPGETKAAN